MKEKPPDQQAWHYRSPKLTNVLHYLALALVFTIVFCVSAGFYIVRCIKGTLTIEGGIIAIAAGTFMGIISVKKIARAGFSRKLHDDDHSGF